MPLPCHVQMEDQGLVGLDDGTSAWCLTALSLMVGGRVLNANVLVDGYTGNQTLRIIHDGIGLDRPTAKTLLLKVYNVAGVTMRRCSCDLGGAFLDLEALIENSFYRVQAAELIKHIRADQ
jgi:hypothetical protein